MVWYSHLSKSFPQFVMIHTVTQGQGSLGGCHLCGRTESDKGKARAELRPARRQARLPHSRSLLLPGRER